MRLKCYLGLPYGCIGVSSDPWPGVASCLNRPGPVVSLTVPGVRADAIANRPWAVRCVMMMCAARSTGPRRTLHMFASNDHLVLRLHTCPGGLTGVEVVDRADDDGGRLPTVNLSAQEIRALFEGPPLARAIARANMPPGRFSLIFGRSYDSARGLAPHYRQAMELRRLGKRLVDPGVREELAQAPMWILRAAAKEADADGQLRAVMRARIDRRARVPQEK